MVKDFLSLLDFSTDEIHKILNLAHELKTLQKKGLPHRWLRGKTQAMIFEKPSLRTKLTFQIGMFHLGGETIVMDMKLGERESVPDVAKNLERWVDLIVARTYSHDDLVCLAQNAKIPVINALSDLLHPCQIMADIMTLQEHFSHKLENICVAFVGDGNNVFHSWAESLIHFPFRLRLVCPEGYSGNPDLIGNVKKKVEDRLEITHDVVKGLKDVDVVYTDVWASMGQEHEAEQRSKIFAPYQVNSKLMSRAKPGAKFMHCLPAHRGMEVTSEVIDSPESIVYDQAENRLHVQKAIMVTLLGYNPH
ncbi:MAG TPA: ornithine carbamoyltransferase [Candidatus Hydrogenedens sp.]|nr:ornithine carbamoyltransferase [Candidatus Hydrogenedens sp.]HOL19431.1 ornithine carbamoyltransferase [Candidatus Hydrogenedens sp.]HPP58260.1 ornithine carbamoyltransferase [Candidatus Hydrogenedens sp.]